MDYSTVSNKTNLTEIEELCDGEITEKYYLLRRQYDNLSSNYEATKQELHEAKRNYQTALDVQSHLNAELESLQAGEEKRRAELGSRISMLQEQILTLRDEHSETAERHLNEVKELETEIRRLKEANATVVNRTSPERDTAELDEIRLALTTTASEAASAKLALEEARNEITSWRLKVEELVTEMGELRAAAEVRREELRAAAEREAAALAELVEARAALQQLDTQASQPHAVKGNSIFAEVEDKRQEMAKNLIQMKQTNSRLRREVASKQAEVEALLQEKHALWEAQAGATAHHDRELLEGYCERITQLEGVCERQRRELARWGRSPDPAHPAHPAWLPAVLQHLKIECEQLRAEVVSRGAAQLASAAQVRDLRRRLAQLGAAHKHSLSPPAPAAPPHAPASPPPSQTSAPAPAHAPAPAPAPIRRVAVDDVKKKVTFD